MPIRAEHHPCFILHHRPYSESSLILDIFSLHYGRVSLMARGARSSRRRWSALLQPLRRLQLAWTLRAELGTLIGAEADGPPYRLSGRRLLSAFYLNELLLRLLHGHEPHPQLFADYADSLAGLAGPGDEERVLRLFEKRLLQALGYGLVLDHEAGSGSPVRAEADYYYHFDHGPEASKLGGRDALRVSGRTLLALYNEDYWDAQVAAESKRLLRGSIDSHLGVRALRSRELYRAYVQHRPAAGPRQPE